jgi:uncharacterized membrane protein
MLKSWVQPAWPTRIPCRSADVGIDDKFIDSVKQRVTPGTSALFLLSSDAVTDRVKGTFTDLSPELIASNLSADQEAKLREVFTED